MKKYWFVYSLYWQEGLTLRASFLMERFRSLVVLLSFYYLWDTLLATRDSFAGYNREQMITYVFGMNILRSLVFAGRTDDMAWEINRGVLSGYLLKPVNFPVYAFSRDLSVKSINLLSAIFEVFVLSHLLGMGIAWPEQPITWLFFILSVAGAIVMYFMLSFIFGCWGFWTAESGGPRFFLELILEFSAGAFFPLDVLPLGVQNVLKMLPSPYLIFFPLHIFLEKLGPSELAAGLATQLFWIIILAGITRFVWMKGLQTYAAHGS